MPGTVDKAVKFISGMDPDFAKHISGSSPAEIADLEACLGRPLPTVHKRFLELMGSSMDWVSLGAVDFNAAALIDAYGSTEGKPPPGVSLLAVVDEEGDEDLYLLEQRGGQPTIVGAMSVTDDSFQSLDLSDVTPIASSMAELLCVPALFEVRVNTGQHAVFLRAMRREHCTLSALADWAVDAGFDIMWFSSPTTIAAEREDAVLIGRQPAQYALAATVASPDESEAKKLSEELQRALGLLPGPAT